MTLPSPVPRLVRLRTFACAIPLEVPFVTAHRRVTTARDVILCLDDESGMRGWGSAPPTLPLTGESTATLLAFLDDVAVPWLSSTRRVPSRPDDARALMAELGRVAAHNAGAKGALETALLDLLARREGVPLFRYLSGSAARAVPLATDVTLSIDAPDAMAARARVLARRGFRSFKVKLSGDAELDGARLMALAGARPEIADDIGAPLAELGFRLDANEAFDEEGALRFFSEAEGLFGESLEVVEQPVRRAEWKALRRLSRALTAPVFADEAAMSLSEVRFLLEEEACDGVVVKLSKAGGPLGFLAWCEACANAQARILASCMLEAQPSLAAAWHATQAFLALHPSYLMEGRLRADLDGGLLLAADPFMGNGRLVARAGLLSTVGDSPGLGLEADARTWRLEGAAPPEGLVEARGDYALDEGFLRP